MRLLTLAALVTTLGAATGPAEAWDYSEYWQELEVYISTYQNDPSGDYQLSLSCSDLMPDDSDISIYTPEEVDQTASYAPEVPLTVTVDGVATGPIKAKFVTTSGKVSIVAYEGDDPLVRPLFSTLKEAKQTIEISYFDKVLSFPIDGAGYMVGRFLESCNGESLF